MTSPTSADGNASAFRIPTRRVALDQLRVDVELYGRDASDTGAISETVITLTRLAYRDVLPLEMLLAEIETVLSDIPAFLNGKTINREDVIDMVKQIAKESYVGGPTRLDLAD